MKNFFKMVISLILLSLLPFMTGCRSMAVSKAQKEMQTTFDGIIGYSEEDVIMRLGAPRNIQQVSGDMKIYYYYQSYGMRSNAYANATAYSAYGNARSWESYDQAEIVFKNGHAVSWKGYVQR